jgi:hypothetical protein
MANPVKAQTVPVGEQPAMRAAPRGAGRVAQFLLGVPLGLFQLGAVVVFTLTDSPSPCSRHRRSSAS